MNFIRLYFSLALVVVSHFVVLSYNMTYNIPDPYQQSYTMSVDTIPLVDRSGDFVTDSKHNPFDIKPKNIDQKVEYDPVSGQYIIYEKIGDIYYRTPSYMTFDEYMDYQAREQERKYFNSLAGIKSEKKSKSGIIDPMDKIDLENTLVDRLFGGSEVNINPQGSVDLSVGMLYTKSENPRLFRPTFLAPDINPKIKMSVDGKIGTKMKLDFNYDTQSSFDFDRQIKLGFDSGSFTEDDIIKKIEAGNVSFPLRGNLIQGAQSLWGLKTELQFGRLFITALASQQRSKSNNIKVENGVSVQDFEIYPDDYDENRHFFISHYNRNTYERSLSNLPYIGSSHQIAQIEVWVSDDRPEFQENSTMVAAIADLGEPESQYLTSAKTIISPMQSNDESGLPLPKNGANNIYNKLSQYSNINNVDKVNSILVSEFGMKQSTDFEVFRGRRLNPSEYTYHPKLGTISLNSRLRPNQVLGIAYNYYYTTICDTLFQVGQLSASSVLPSNQTDTTQAEPPKVHFVKLLKPTNQLTTSPMWDLMMKNVYPLRTTQLNPQDFEFDIYYEDDFSDGSLKKYLPEPAFRNLPLLQLFNLDRLNRYGDRQADGYFDYISGITVIERSGSIVFPVLEPFGGNLSVANFNKQPGTNLPDSLDNLLKEKYRFQQLYDSILVVAKQYVEKNKFVMRGKVKSSTNNGEIALGPFVPQGSVRVSAGSKTLIEGQDYEIDYSLGRLRIINETYLAQGTPINVQFEDNSVFNLQNKSMLGLRAEYVFDKKNSIGATYLKLKERPFTTKVNVGDDPINNTIIGLDYNFSNEAPWITKLVDRLPFYSTTQKSSINFIAEAAMIRPGHAKAINSKVKSADGKDNIVEDSGIANIDDFEGAISTFNLGGLNPNIWVLSSTPSAFKESNQENQLVYGANRARLNWYVLDQGVTSRTAEDNADPYTKFLRQNDLFKNRQVLPGQNILFTFDMSYYPSERGPYNFESRDGYAGYSKGFKVVNNEIVLNDPKTRWGGITRYFQNSDFETANYESIEFWLLNPFIDSRDHKPVPGEEGEVIINLGSISEDILKDNLLYFENANPTSQRKAPTSNTVFGKATISIPLVNGFDVREGTSQDIGFDGINDDEERAHYSKWMADNNIASIQEVFNDPSNDNFVFFNDQKFVNEPNILKRFKEYNGPEGNAPLDVNQNQTNNNAGSFVRGNNLPETEDLNNNKTLDVNESYYEYRLKLKNKNGEIDTANLKYFRQVVVASDQSIWYRFQIPIREVFDTVVGNIQGFRNIQFMRMYMTGFETSKTFRMAEFQLQRSIWRKQKPTCDGEPNNDIDFVIDDVGLEENADKLPFNYQVPKGVLQTRVAAASAQIAQDEKSMALRFKHFPNDCQISVTKLARLNMVVYKRLQMFVHAEHGLNQPELNDGDLTLFVRLGKDFVNNYYEYRLPLKMSKVADNQVNENIWKNKVDIPLDSLLNLKRIRISNSDPANVVVNGVINPEKGDEIIIKGNPSLGEVKGIQVGVINTTANPKPIDGEVWINELRVVGFDEKGGYAAQSKLQIQMADLGEINAATNYSSIGYGGLDKRLLERNREETIQYDIAANIDAGKLLPKAAKLTIPMYAQYSKTIINPEYDPYDQDINLKNKLELIQDDNFRAEVKERANETTTIKTFNLTNVKTQVGGTGKPWSPSNINVSYAYTQTLKTDPIIKSDNTVNRSIGLDYVYSRKSKYFEPFKGIKSKALKPIADLNISFLPSNFSFISRMIDYKNTRTFRQPVTPVFIFDDQRFNWERNYVLDWDLTKSIRLNFRANTNSIVDQLRQVGIADNPEDRKYVDEYNNPI
ncbi:MAG: cell surface protein SprA, partial [Lewinellaceae bacterium]|nr:cell surface protein SprA [Lewinellaceae bacterium]